jgi:hypothetical protein
MDPDACITAINEASERPAWARDLATWVRAGGYLPATPLTYLARRKMVRSGFGWLARTLDKGSHLTPI